MDPKVTEIARAVRTAGGRALLVGGYVRDRLRGEESKDYDVEVFGLDLAALQRVLGRFGEVIAIGRAFGVLQVKGLGIDFSLPRRDSKIAAGHKGFEIEFDPGLDFATAARRRDLTMNSIGLDPLTEEVLDPHGGRADLARKVLRATDPSHFSEDPLRGLRVAQFAARFEMTPDAELEALCRALDLAELSAERILEEWRKLLLKGVRPSLGTEFLRRTGLLRFTPELAALIDVPQDPEWHPEGDCWVHNQRVIDEAARLRDGGPDDAALMFGALLHDVGKPPTTVNENGRVRSPAHDVRGVELAQQFLSRMRAPNDLVTCVSALVEHHLAPALYVKQGSTAKAYRRLARKLGAAGASAELLVRVARADHWGRTTDEAVNRVFPAGDEFLARARELTIERKPPQDVVLGRHLIARGMQPGPKFGVILERCREIQDETGWSDPERILDRALAAGTQPGL
jgi:tRNA nucleotidyltransferase (CCA-adding enzyme)